MAPEHYLVPRYSFSERAQLREALFACIDELDEHGFEFVESGHHESDTNRVTRFSDEPETSHVELWEDYLAAVRYLRLEAPEERILSRSVRVVTRMIATESHETLCASMDDSAEPSVLYRIGYSAPRAPSQETIDVVTAALQSTSPELATAAAEVAGIIGWAAFVEPLRALDGRTEPGRLRQAVRRSLGLLSQRVSFTRTPESDHKMPWLSLCSHRFRFVPRAPSQAISPRNYVEVARGILRSFYRGDRDGVLRWKEAGEEAWVLLRKDALDESRDHGIEFVSAFATLVAADLILGEGSEILDYLGRWSSEDPLAQRALQLLSSPPSVDVNARVRRGHIYAARALERGLVSEPIERLHRLVTTADHPLFQSTLAPWVPIVGLSIAVGDNGTVCRNRLSRFLSNWDVESSRDVVFERQRPAPVPGDPDEWTADYASRNVAFSDAEFRGFDAVEVRDEGVICYHYIEAIWQIGDVEWPEPANAFWFLSESDLEQAWAEVESRVSAATWGRLCDARARSAVNCVVADRKRAPEYFRGRSAAQARYGVEIVSKDLMEV
ncbi:MAG: HEAT repeat domain-containing protein [Nannocystaceae bacterium]|nr:HEAT repeat domain-containing protein [bacterium]